MQHVSDPTKSKTLLQFLFASLDPGTSVSPSEAIVKSRVLSLIIMCIAEGQTSTRTVYPTLHRPDKKSKVMEDIPTPAQPDVVQANDLHRVGLDVVISRIEYDKDSLGDLEV